jgi:hypothetical protein
MTSAGTFPQRLTKIDDLARPDHFYLTPVDDCYFLGEYTARKGFAFSATNQLILNFKKSMDKRATAQWRYKEKAIEEAAAAFRASLNSEWLEKATLARAHGARHPCSTGARRARTRAPARQHRGGA